MWYSVLVPVPVPRLKTGTNRTVRLVRAFSRRVLHGPETATPGSPPALASELTTAEQLAFGSSSQPKPPGVSDPEGPAGQVPALAVVCRYATRSIVGSGSGFGGEGGGGAHRPPPPRGWGLPPPTRPKS